MREYRGVMVFDLGKAMRKKEEFESSRLMDFEFRQRARAARLLARHFGLDEAQMAQETVLLGDEAMVDLLVAQSRADRGEVSAQFIRCMAEARRELVAERGDPTPNRLG